MALSPQTDTPPALPAAVPAPVPAAYHGAGNTSAEAFLADARKRMVDSQLRPNRVSDPFLLEAMRTLPRENFLPASLRALAYADQTIDLGEGRVMPQPMVLARMIQAAGPVRGEKVLVVGAGTGYAAAVLASYGCAVTAVEQAPGLLALAKTALAAEAPSVSLVTGKLTEGWAAGGPFDLILVDGAVPSVPVALVQQLNRATGRLVAVINEGDRTGHAVIAEPTPAGVSVRALFDCLSPVLPGFAAAPAFEF